MLEQGAHVDAQGAYPKNHDHYYSSTALVAAALSGYEKIVELLLSAGANVNAASKQYRNAVQAAARSGNIEIVSFS